MQVCFTIYVSVGVQCTVYRRWAKLLITVALLTSVKQKEVSNKDVEFHVICPVVNWNGFNCALILVVWQTPCVQLIVYQVLQQWEKLGASYTSTLIFVSVLLYRMIFRRFMTRYMPMPFLYVDPSSRIYTGRLGNIAQWRFGVKRNKGLTQHHSVWNVLPVE